MRKFLFLLLLIFSFHKAVLCQTNAKITDIDLRLENNNIVVTYFITGYLPNEVFSIGLKFLTDDNQEIIPLTTRGDIGDNIKGDSIKTIAWDFSADKFEFSGVLHASVSIIKAGLAVKPLGGPSCAWLSVIVPGLGGYFVYKNKACPVFTTLTLATSLTLGILYEKKAKNAWENYNKSTDYDKGVDYYNDANKYHHISFVSYRIFFGMWITDIIFVAAKGGKNQKEARSGKYSFSGNGFNMYYVNNGIQLGYKRSF